MKKIILVVLLLGLFNAYSQKVFDVHIHGEADPSIQMQQLENSGVYKAAISTSWDLQNTYRESYSGVQQQIHPRDHHLPIL